MECANTDGGNLDARGLVNALYERLLLRPPDPAGEAVHIEFVEEGGSARELEARIRASREYREVVAPLVEEISGAYRTLAREPPSAQDLWRHLAAFRSHAGDLDRAIASIRAGRALELVDLRPLWVEMDVTNQCNLRCAMCYFSDPRVARRQRHDVSLDEYEALAASLFPFAHKVSLSFGAEPLLHPRLARFVEIAKDRRVPHVYFYTNVMPLTHRVARDLVDARLDLLAVSLESITPSVYERIRAGARLERLLANLRLLQRVKEEKGADRPRVAFNVVLMRSTVEELPAIVERASSLGVCEIGTCHLVPYSPAMERESLFHDKTLFNTVADRAFRVARECGIVLSLPPRFAAAEPAPVRHEPPTAPSVYERAAVDAPQARACTFPWHFVGIDAEGNVLPCGWWHGEHPMGNLSRTSFREVWQGEAYAQLREDLREGRLRAACRVCPSAGAGRVDDPSSFAARSLLGE